MTRSFANILARALIGHAASEKHPTRSVEYMLTWLGLSWSLMIGIPHVVIPPSIAVFFTVVPILAWVAAGIIIGGLRLFALIRNGGWSKSPWLRMIGAALGFNFWLAVGAFYVLGFFEGRPILPLHGCIPVVMFFEAYSCFRCGQDARRVTESSRLPDSVVNG